MINEKSFGFWIVIVGLVVMLVISLVSVFRYTSVGDASGAITAAGTVVGTFFGVHASRLKRHVNGRKPSRTPSSEVCPRSQRPPIRKAMSRRRSKN